MAVLAIQTPEDGLLGALAPLGLGASVDTALVVDLDPHGPHYPGSGSLARLIEAGPRRADLQPQRQGLAVLANGGIAPAAAGPVVEALCRKWPHVVLRLAPREPAPSDRATVTVQPLVPGRLFGTAPRSAFQDLGFRVPVPDGAVRLPVIGRSVAAAFLAGALPVRSKWVRAWTPLWEAAWE